MIVCVTTMPNNPWLAELIEDKGDMMIVRGQDGIDREVSILECEILDEEDEKEIIKESP